MTSIRPPRRGARLLPIGRFFGVPMYFAPSWLIIAALLTVYYAPVVRNSASGASESSAYLLAFAFACSFALCVLAHELGHTAVSLLLGTPVRRVTIFLLGGISELERDPERPRDEFLIALAGPAVSLLLAGAAWLGSDFVKSSTMPGVLIALLFWSNLVVAVFNLLPGLPLDGGRLLRAAGWAITGNRLRGTSFGALCGKVVAVAVAVLGIAADRSTMGFTAGLFAIAIAVYLWVGASQSVKLAQVVERVPQLDLKSLLRPGLLVPADISVAEALRRAWSGHARGLVLVDSAGNPHAIVDELQVGSISPDQRPWTPVTAVSRTLEPGMRLPVSMSGDELFTALRATPAHEYLAVDADGNPAGILAMADVAAALTAADQAKSTPKFRRTRPKGSE